MPETLFIVYTVLFGLVAGSFITMLTVRIPENKSVLPASRCDSCDTRLKPLDLIPVLSWMFLKGKCRYCSAEIGKETPLIELVTVAGFSYSAWLVGFTPALPAFWVFIIAVVALAAIDFKTMLLPRVLIYLPALIGFTILSGVAWFSDEKFRITGMVSGALLGAFLLGLVYVLSRGGLGDGDVRLAVLIGVYIGWFNPAVVPIALFFGFLLGSIWGVALIIFSDAGRKTMVPFGPFLIAGAFLGFPPVGNTVLDFLLSR